MMHVGNKVTLDHQDKKHTKNSNIGFVFFNAEGTMWIREKN